MTQPRDRSTHRPTQRPTHRQWPLLFVLAGAQFSHVLDFVIMMPLGPEFINEWSITPQQFGFLVSVYTFSGAICSFLGAFAIDRFDRKTALLWLYCGFTIGTIACAFAPSYLLMLFGRAITGAFGGLMGAIVFSIVGDVFSEERRGAAMGTVMSAFSLASVLGVPIGLWLAHVSWRVPFFGLAAVSLIIILLAIRILPNLSGHLSEQKKIDLVAELRFLVLTKSHWASFGLIVCLMFAAFTVIPYIAAYLNKNVGLGRNDLALMYLVGGFFTLITSRLVGRMADRFGKQQVFRVMALLSTIPIILITNLPRTSLPAAIAVSTLFSVLISGRAVPAMSMITSTVDRAHRGSFMSFTSAVQQLASGVATLIGGMILLEAPTGELLHYQWVGATAVVATIISVFLASKLQFAADS
jgi:predicted MFS family arabinose efflux permease